MSPGATAHLGIADTVVADTRAAAAGDTGLDVNHRGLGVLGGTPGGGVGQRLVETSKRPRAVQIALATTLAS
jgi:hypothetical protein